MEEKKGDDEASFHLHQDFHLLQDHFSFYQLTCDNACNMKNGVINTLRQYCEVKEEEYIPYMELDDEEHCLIVAHLVLV